MEYEVQTTDVFDKWAKKLKDNQAKANIYKRIYRMQKGHLGDVKIIVPNIYEARIFTSKGYRLYFTIRNGEILILLCGGHKDTQQKDIKNAQTILNSLEE